MGAGKLQQSRLVLLQVDGGNLLYVLMASPWEARTDSAAASIVSRFVPLLQPIPRTASLARSLKYWEGLSVFFSSDSSGAFSMFPARVIHSSSGRPYRRQLRRYCPLHWKSEKSQVFASQKGRRRFPGQTHILYLKAVLFCKYIWSEQAVSVCSRRNHRLRSYYGCGSEASSLAPPRCLTEGRLHTVPFRL